MARWGARPGLGDREGPLTECQTAAVDYQALGWSAAVFDTTVWVIASHPVEALDVPDHLGPATLDLLRDNGITPCVFIAPDPEEIRQVFLVVRNDLTWPRYRAQLADLGVRHVWAGATLHLPPSEFSGRRLTWITAPSQPLPEFTTVAEAIIRAGDLGTP